MTSEVFRSRVHHNIGTPFEGILEAPIVQHAGFDARGKEYSLEEEEAQRSSRLPEYLQRRESSSRNKRCLDTRR